MISTLLVDSVSHLCAEISGVLSRWGLCAQIGNTPEKALRLVRQSLYDVNLLKFDFRSESEDSASPERGLG